MTENLPPPPTSFKPLGILSLLFGLALGAFNTLMPLHALSRLSSISGVEDASIAILVCMALLAIPSLLLTLGGIGLARGRSWGRTLCLIFSWSILPCLIVAVIILKIAENLVELKGGPSESFNVMVGGAFLAPIVAVILLVKLLGREASQWALQIRYGAAADQIPPLCPQAVMSLILAFVPMMMLTQIASFILGIVALVKISRSKGKLRGTGLAWAGTILSFILIAGIGALIAFAVRNGMR